MTKSVLITGTSSGFGLESAVALAGRGWRVFATMRDPSRDKALLAAAADRGVTVEVVALDVCDPASIEAAVADVLGRTGGELDAVVHNAGLGDAGFFEDMPDDMARRVMETNFFGVLALTRAVLPAMRARRRGRIVALSSVGTFFPGPALSLYQASKCAVEAWAESLAIEVRPFGIEVALLEPGTYKTAIWDNAEVATHPDSPYRPYVESLEPRMRAMVARTGRDPSEVGAKVAKVLDARRPRFRTPVGPDAHIMRVAGHLPAHLRHRLAARFITGSVTPAPAEPSTP